MRESKDFIIEKLNILFASVEGVKIRYEYRKYMAAHFIEILPLFTFEDNPEYILMEMEIQDEFEELFGSKEEILFISSNSLNEITDVQFSLGYDKMIEKVSFSPITSHFFSSILENIIEDNTSYRLAA